MTKRRRSRRTKSTAGSRTRRACAALKDNFYRDTGEGKFCSAWRIYSKAKLVYSCTWAGRARRQARSVYGRCWRN